MPLLRPARPPHHPLPSHAGRLLAMGLTALLGLALASGLQAAPAETRATVQPIAAPAAQAQALETWTHAYAAYTTPKYPAGFANFDYVRPDAPKRGTLWLRNPDRRSSFDKFNPFTIKGNAPAGVGLFMFESLAARSMDEPQTMYGLLAEQMSVAPDLSSVTFRIHPLARFSDGTPVTAADVVHSHQMLTSPQSSPGVRIGLSDIGEVTALDAATVRFTLKERKIDAVFAAGGMAVFSKAWGAVGGKAKPFDQIVSEHPITSGPYLIDQVEMPRRIEFKLNPRYWARDLGVRRGHFNFERIVYRMYADPAVAAEAFKAGEFDFFKEYSARAWVRQHQGVKWREGRIVKAELPTAWGQGLQSTHFNLRRPIFQDARVREALTLAWDFERLNRYGQYQRSHSLFNNSTFAAQGTPSAEELALLEPFRDQLPPQVFGPSYVAPVQGDAQRLRANLLRARDLLAQAGWKVADDGKLRNAKGEAFVVEYLEPSQPGRNTDFQHNLSKLGIEFKERVVDFALYRRRLETYDYDLITIVEGDFTLPSATDLKAGFGSATVDEPGGNNFRGVKSPAVDALIQAIADAKDIAQLRTAARALDRIVMWNHWQIPELYLSKERVSYWNRFGKPAVQPGYISIDGGEPWPLWTWWVEREQRP
ncbi:extracellular solute-binding protein [Sphaerotilus mobilis]|uniref:Peptide/nickel transport system substrate-binding protein/microcin C transport system substrate-binding protein n=1 Tax=Sphaerotilus mobilis TaxID=47994 RepID=A0A4Q7LVV6_9BURK|nr:extracellular solute-binding protein [Sphaerotilus mobilis]RZS58118.1 peptide/nickel transport system substrate-binding protein/microcin C transport system substrate-binding protein [Sphaerotilus mobilis]